MATKVVGGMAVDLSVRTGRFTSGLKRARGDLKGFQDSLGSNALYVAKWGAALTAAAGTAIGYMVREQARLIDNLAKTSDRLGVSTQALAAFQYQGKLAGVATDQVSQALTYMTRNIGEAIAGNKEMSSAFQRLGLDAQALAKLAPEEQYAQIAERIKGLESPAKRTSAAMDIFGRSGASMLNMLQQGRAGFDQAAKATQEFGTAISRIDAAKVEKMNDRFTAAGEAWSGIKTQITVGVASALDVVIEKTERWRREVKAMGDEAPWYYKAMGLHLPGMSDVIDINAEGGTMSPLNKEWAAARIHTGGNDDSAVRQFNQFKALLAKHKEQSATAQAEVDAARMVATGDFLTNLRDSSRTEIEIENAKWQTIQDNLATARELMAENSAEWDAIEEKAKKEHEAKLTSITKQETEQRRQIAMASAQWIIGTVQSIAESTGASARDQFELNKLAGMTNAAISTYEAATKALTLGPIAGPIAAGVITALGVANVAAISQMQFESGGSSLGASAAVPALSEGSGIQQQQRNMNVVLQGSGRYSRDEVVGFLEQMNEALGDGYRLNVSG